MKRIERDKNRISAFRAVLSATGMLALMGCGKTVVDTTVEQQPTQTIETTVDDPVVDVPVVEPTTDVSDNTTTVEPEEDKFADATFIQTGENEYTINIDCPDNSSEILDPYSVPFYDIALEGGSDNYGISPELVNAILTYGLHVNPSNPTQIDVENYLDNPVLNNLHYDGNRYVVFTNDESQYPDNYYVNSAAELSGNDYVSPNRVQVAMCCMVLKNSITHCNGNLSCALANYSIGDNWDIVMQECKDATGLTDEEIYANYGAEYVLSFDTLGLGNIAFVNGVLQYINEPITISYFDEKGNTAYKETYSLERVKTYGTILNKGTVPAFTI